MVLGSEEVISELRMTSDGHMGRLVTVIDGVERHELGACGLQPSELMSGLEGFRGMRNNCSLKKCLDTGTLSY